MKDIETRADLERWMQKFYEAALADEVLSYIFKEVARLDLKKHLPVICDFWETLLLGNNVYQVHGRNPLQIHAHLNGQSPLTPQHFRRWLEIFRAVTDQEFAGARADFAKLRAEAIANRMQNFIAGVPDFRFTGSKNDKDSPVLRE